MYHAYQPASIMLIIMYSINLIQITTLWGRCYGYFLFLFLFYFLLPLSK
jgi:hypothetical protein